MKQKEQDKRPVTWTIAGFDPVGGAGLQADIKTMYALGTYPCSVITAVIAQNTCCVARVKAVSACMLREQMRVLADDMPPVAVKVGMLANRACVMETGRMLSGVRAFVVCDPVLRSSSGTDLLDEEGFHVLRSCFLPLVDLLTPNRIEAEKLTGVRLRSSKDVRHAARVLRSRGPRAVLIKGGHQPGDMCSDFFSNGSQEVWLHSKRVHGCAGRGTGCTLSAAVAAGIARGLDPLNATLMAKAYINQGLRNAQALGSGPGPLEHGPWPTERRDKPWLTESASPRGKPFRPPTPGKSQRGLRPQPGCVGM